MQLGKGIKESQAGKLAAKVESDLLAGEAIVFVCKCNNFKPLVDRVLLTNQRLLAASVTDGTIKYRASRAEVLDAVVDSGWAGATLTITTTDGTSVVFKSMDVTDAEMVRSQLSAPVGPPSLVAPATDDGTGMSEGKVGVPDSGQPGAPAGFKAKMKKAYLDAQAESQERAEQNRATYGKLIKSGAFGATTVEIYEGGFVRVGNFLTAKSPYEKLASISFSTQVQDKSAGGRALAAGLTLGLSTFTSNEKRILFLTIATDKKVHTLQTEGGMGRTEDKTGLALEAAGKAALETLRLTGSQRTAIIESPPSATVGEQLRQLADLHKEGVLTDEEFAGAKARLLAQL
jgi:hypothetical protein